MIIAIGSVHTGVYYKSLINNFLINMACEIKDFGLFEYEYGEKVDYPDFIHPTAEFVNKGEANLGCVEVEMG